MQSAPFIKGRIHFTAIVIGVLLMACNPTRRLQDNEYLLTKNEIKFTDGSYNKEPLLSIIKQKPNRKILGVFRFHLWLYNTVNEQKMEEKKEEKIKKREAWNAAHPDKTPKDTDDVTTWRETIRKIGEEPVIIDTSLTNRSSRQLGIFLHSKGYFNATVKDSIEVVGKKKAKVVYTINLEEPYKIRNTTDTSKDTLILHYVDLNKSQTLLKKGDDYDEDVLDKERVRITTDLRDSGYYYFNKNYITYSVDSNLNSNQVDLQLYINRVNENVSERAVKSDSMRNHYQYYLNNIYIQTDYNPQSLDESMTSDTIYYNDYIFISTTPYERFKKDVILRTIFFKKGDRFNLGDIDYSYSRINDLNIFKYSNIKFEEAGKDSSGRRLLNAFVQLSPVALQDVSLEPEATRNGGYAGIAGNVAYHNKNLFGGAELLEVKFKIADESQQNITGTIASSDVLFNTLEYGPEVDLSFDRFLFPGSLFKASRYINPKTTFTIGYDVQDRPDYDRSVLTGSYWYTWKESSKVRLTIYLAEISSIEASNISQAFINDLVSLHNPTLSNSFNTHIITSVPRSSMEYSDQEAKHGANFNFLRIDEDYGVKFFSNSFGFLKLDADYRHYFKLNAHNTLVVRAFAGAGIPFDTAQSLPFEKAFYAGGSNDIRAWRFSTLGPGSTPNPLGIEQVGDAKLEGNIELRSELFKFFEGAAFADFGNIWNRPGDINFDQFAVGAGLGLRLNFNFFIFRIDAAVPIYDPTRDDPDKWVYSHQTFEVSQINFNFGIGYPF